MLALDADGLGELARRKETLATEGRIAEKSRVDVTRRLAEALGIDEQPVTLSLLCTRTDPGDSRLRDAQSRLVALVGAVRELADANRALGAERLSSVQSTLRLLGRLVPVVAESGTAYGRDRELPAASAPGRLVRTSA